MKRARAAVQDRALRQLPVTDVVTGASRSFAEQCSQSLERFTELLLHDLSPEE